MSIFGDLHIHSRFARACSPSLTLASLETYARMKGITLLGTGDFTHPTHFNNIVEQLQEDEHGVLWSEGGFPFLWQTEISFMYTHQGKGRRVHHLVLAPGREVVEQIIEFLGKKGRMDYDGRPIFGMSSVEFIEGMMALSKDIEIIPAHAWTPYFGILGSKSGYDTVQECFEEKSKYVHAIETGLSSDPPMNWRVSSLDAYQLVSFSDLHSHWPWRMGREATIFDCALTYKTILRALRTGEGLAGTVEVDPHYGKYHVDGHRNCGVVMEPRETKKVGGACPKCNQQLTIGVLHRVEMLADREVGNKPAHAKQFFTLAPLSELIGAVYGIEQLSSKKIWEIYTLLIKRFGNELAVLLQAPQQELVNVAGEALAKVIVLNREGKLKVSPGYDGVYGKLLLEQEHREGKHSRQKSLEEF